MMLYTFQQSSFLFDQGVYNDADGKRSYTSSKLTPFHLVPDGVNAFGAAVDLEIEAGLFFSFRGRMKSLMYLLRSRLVSLSFWAM